MKRGFTLLETILYLALFAVLMGGVASSFFLLFQSADRNKTKAMLQEEEAYLRGKIEWSLSGARSVSVPAVDESGSSLDATKYDGTETNVGLSGSDLIWNGVSLNNANVAVSNLVFMHAYAGGTNPESIEAGFTVTTKTENGVVISEIASTTRYIRK